ncbi:hypothetical protein, partial [Streptomyces lunaelactis]|uniref:hypothetical protein n=1 Tax=Streptomyces lunaelactis TaxID=1535768 RepID=UPI001C308FBD
TCTVLSETPLLGRTMPVLAVPPPRTVAFPVFDARKREPVVPAMTAHTATPNAATLKKADVIPAT